GVAGDVAEDDRAAGADRPPRAALRGAAIAPGQAEPGQVVLFETGVGQRNHRLVRPRSGLADPGHAVAADVDDDPADVLEQAGGLGAVHQRAGDAAHHPQRAVLAGGLEAAALALGNV